LGEEQKKPPLRQHALKMTENIIQNMGIHGSITGKMLTRILSFNHKTNCYYSYSSSKTVTDEENEL